MPTTPEQEKYWLEAMGRGDTKAFRAMYDAYWPVLYTTARNVLKDPGLAEDAVQEVFASIWARRASLAIRTSLGAYLKQAVKYMVFKAINDQRRADSQPAGAMPDVHAQTPHDILGLAEFVERYAQALGSLPEKQREVFLMHRDEGLSYTQIAKKLDISPKTVEARMGRVLKALRVYLKYYFAVAKLALAHFGQWWL